MQVIKVLVRVFLIILLTILTQVGGVVLLITFTLNRRIEKAFRLSALQQIVKIAVFCCLYLLTTFTLVPVAAKLFGRVRLPMTEHRHLKPLNIVTCLLNRNYVRPEMRDITYSVAEKANSENSNFTLCYLDANFPFFNHFPLIPHLSHNDGKKLDLAFCYWNKLNQCSSPSWIGYGVSEEPTADEASKAEFCKNHGYFQYGFLNKIVSQKGKANVTFDATTTAKIVKLFAAEERIGKIFIEPHLKLRLGLEKYDKIRFQGCHSVRHDDHIHIQLK